MTAFLIHCFIIDHTKITIYSLYWNILPYCDDNTPPPYFPIISLIFKAEIKINDAWDCILNIYHRRKLVVLCLILLNFTQIKFCKKYVTD